MEFIRNIAIIAHVDHGKTTLVDQLLRQSGTFRENQHTDERMMDSMDLERERGITIRAKNAAFKYGEYHVNIVDTPGHADFGGEVERIMKMVDGVLLVVDAYEGPQAQTKFVLRKALENGAKPLVVINKIDRENARPHKVLDMIFELFLELNANDEQLDFPVIYGSARDGYAMKEVGQASSDMKPLFDAIIEHIPSPPISKETYFAMAVSNLDYSDYLGRLAYGRIVSGRVAVGDTIVAIRQEHKWERATVTAIFSHAGMEKIKVQHASAGDIVGIAGVEEISIGDTITDSETRPALAAVLIDPPTIKMGIMVNDSPMAGREGKFLTARHIRERLIRETRTNVSLRVNDTDAAGIFEIEARGEMQIAVLVEQMRREGFELMVSPPQVIFKEDEAGNQLEPIERLYVDLPEEHLGDLMKLVAARRGEVINMEHHSAGVNVESMIPTRGLIGFESDLVNLSRGMATISHLFAEYAPHKGEIVNRISGVLIAKETGKCTAYSLASTQERGKLFVGPGDEVYEGMIIGENKRPDDLVVNPCKEKHLNNMRSSGDGKGIQLDPPARLSLEKVIEYIAPDELVEVTPGFLRMRKKYLDPTARKRAGNKV